MESKEYDYINPSHYKKGEKEVYEMMIDIWGVDYFIKHCEMCAFKYRMRLGDKPDQPVERDLDKARWYEAKAKQLKALKPSDVISTIYNHISASTIAPTRENYEYIAIADTLGWSERKKATFKFFNEFPEPYRSQAKDNYDEEFCTDNTPTNPIQSIMWGFKWDDSIQGQKHWSEFKNSLEV